MTPKNDIDFRECQDNEFLSITAIFPDEVTDLRKPNKSSKWMPLEIEVRVYPEESMTGDREIDIQADLYVKCSEKYPESPPFIDIRKSKGISYDDLKILKEELLCKVKELAGKEMILELVYHTRSFLYAHKKPQYQSFYDEMLSNKRKKLEEEAQRQEKIEEELKLKEHQKLISIEQEKQRKMEAFKDASKRARFADEVEPTSEKVFVPRQRSRSTSVGKDTSSKVENSCITECKEMLNSKLKFSGKKELIVQCGHCIEHNERGCVTYYSTDTQTGMPMIVIKWVLNFDANRKLKGEEWDALQKELNNYLKQLAVIEQEFKSLRQLNCKHLVHYLGMSYFARKDKIVIHVLQDYISGCPIKKMYSDLQLTVPQLQHYIQQILEALKYLHDSSIVHKNLRLSSLFIDNNGSIRVSDYSLDKRLYDLYRTLTKEEEIDLYPPTIGKGGKKGDIYRLGVLILCLINEPQTGTPVNVPEYLNPTFKDFLNKCLMHNEHERWSAEQLLTHAFLASPSAHNLIEKELEANDDKLDSINHLMLNDEGIQGSRLLNEFDILKVLGKGGFGHVWKVKNKLDSRVYALKRIPLNPSNKQLNRKIKREVKLLSRLNHENIVRYYNSWIEATPDVEGTLSKDSVSQSEDKKAESFANSSVQWEILDKGGSTSDEDDCEYDDEDDFIIFLSEHSKANIDLCKRDVPETDGSSTVEQVSVDSDTPQSKLDVRQFMYIQMEFCEKSTLRTAIDNGLYKDVSLVWRLFREIVEGLHYIHQQGVIHRDLKPVNIFLDSKDRVKIGDFGLATDVISKSFVGDITFNDVDPQSRSEADDGTQTGKVGTTFYVAPELSSALKASYSQKVDIYSLGIIFFEMCYPPPVTGMERTLIISNLRLRDIILPLDAKDILTEEMVHIISWLLQHDVSKRPSSNELITSKYIPPLLMEETELNSLLHTTVSNPQSRMYKHMISALFDQEVSTEFDFTYDMDVYKSQSFKSKPTQMYSTVVDILNKIMRLHGAVYYSVPSLMPKNSVVDCDNCVHIMEHGGAIVMLPYNLRVPFARYIARREIFHLKRYSLEKVYRQQKVFGCHPREQYEFAFDIVTPTPDSFLPDAEIIATVSEIISEFSSLECRSYYIRINHANLLKAILLYSEFDEQYENELYMLAGKQKYKTITKNLVNDYCSNLDLSQRTISRLSQFVELEESLDKITTCLHPMLQKKGRICNLAKTSLKELENILKLTQSLDIKLPILICPGLAHNITFFSGMIFQCVCKLKSSKRKDIIDIFAVGGRYDKLIDTFKLKTQAEGVKSLKQSAVGVSVAVESIVTAELEVNEKQGSGVADFLIHSEDSGMASEKAMLLKKLWDWGVRASVLYDKSMTFDDAVEFCKINGIPHILALRKDEPGILKIRIVEKDRVYDKRIIDSELKEQVLKLCPRVLIDITSPKIGDYSRSPSFSTNSSFNHSVNPSVNVRFLPSDKTHANRKREQNIRSHVISILQGTSSHFMELIPIDLKMNVIGKIISHCDIAASIDGIQRSFDCIIDEFNKHKKYLSQLCEEICDIRTKRANCTIALYSLPDNNFRVLL